jgi:release factor glutamine methyltransferase
MLPTPSTSHVSFDRVYEPAEDSFLLLDTLSGPSETVFLKDRFRQESQTGVPLVVEVGTGSGVVLSFVAANALDLFGHAEILTLGTDINSFACRAAKETVEKAVATKEGVSRKSVFLTTVNADLLSPIRPNTVDVLIFNPPYVPTEELPDMEMHPQYNASGLSESKNAFERDSHLLALSYAGGEDGMEITNQLLDQLPSILSKDRGVAYILLCAQNKPEKVKERIRAWGTPWAVETAGNIGKQGGWEKLQIIRIWRDSHQSTESP